MKAAQNVLRNITRSRAAVLMPCAGSRMVHCMLYNVSLTTGSRLEHSIWSFSVPGLSSLTRSPLAGSSRRSFTAASATAAPASADVTASSTAHCVVCGQANVNVDVPQTPVKIVSETSSFDSDIGGRPHDFSLLSSWIHACSSCGYAADDISTATSTPVSKEVVAQAKEAAETWIRSHHSPLEQASTAISSDRIAFAKTCLAAAHICVQQQQHARVRLNIPACV